MISSASNYEPASSASQIGDLTPEQQTRLTQLLDQYLLGLEQGEPVDVPAMLRENSDLAHVLSVYLAKLDGLHGIAAGFQSHGELEPLVSGEPGSAVQSLELGDYTIIRELGRGGMGIVYEARQRSLDRRVALKLLPLASMLDSRQIARFKNESHAAAQLQHPNIVAVYNVGVERGIHHYAMQFIEGRTVDRWIDATVKSDSTTQWRETVRIVIDVAKALHCAHECGIVHRDVKPSNLMLDQSGKVWVTDFGLARCQNDLSLTLSGHLVGTIRYMSPEQASGRVELVDHRTDIYSLGATLYEMLSGRVAVPGDDSPSVLREIVTGKPVRIRRIMKQLPADLDVVLQKAMSKEKDERYATAEDFADDLQAVLDDRPTVAKPPSPAVIAGRWAKNHRRLVAAVSTVCAIGVIGLLASVLIITQKNRELKASYSTADLLVRRGQEAVNDLGSRNAARLASVPGAEHIRHALLNDTLAYYQDFVAHATGDSALQADLARTHSKIGDLVRELESANKSLDHYKQSAEIYEALADQSLDSTETIAGQAHNLNQYGLALFAAGRSSQAQDAYQQAIELQHQMIASEDEAAVDRTSKPDVGPNGIILNPQLALALTKNNLGLLLRDTGHLDAARINLTEAINAFQAITGENAIANGETRIAAVRGMAAALANLSSLSMESDPKKSIALLNAAIDFQLAIRNDSSNPLTATGEIATNYNSLGAAHLADNQPRIAADAFSKSAQMLRSLNAIAPKVDQYRFELAVCLGNLALAHHKSGRDSNAIEVAGEALIALQTPSPSPMVASSFGVELNNLGSLLEAMNEKGKAIEAYHGAVKHQRSALSRDAGDQQFGAHLLKHYSNLLRVQIADRRWHEIAGTGDAYCAAAKDHPDRLIDTAEDLARLAKKAPAGSARDRLVEDLASTLVAARQSKSGDFDSELLLRQPFRDFAHLPHLRKAVHP